MKAHLDGSKLTRAAVDAAVRTKSTDDTRVEKAKSIDGRMLGRVIEQLGEDGRISSADLNLLKLFISLLEQLGENVSSSQSPTIAGSALDEVPESARHAVADMPASVGGGGGAPPDPPDPPDRSALSMAKTAHGA